VKMMNGISNFKELIEKSKSDNEAMLRIIELFEPKLYKSLYQTAENNREDLKQDLLIKLMVSVKKYDVDTVPGFWEFKKQLTEKTS